MTDQPTQDAIVAWLRSEQLAHEGSYQDARRSNDYVGMGRCAARVDAIRSVADAIERGDFGAGEG